jgi:uncharacterized membrane protein YgcG
MKIFDVRRCRLYPSLWLSKFDNYVPLEGIMKTLVEIANDNTDEKYNELKAALENRRSQGAPLNSVSSSTALDKEGDFFEGYMLGLFQNTMPFLSKHGKEQETTFDSSPAPSNPSQDDNSSYGGDDSDSGGDSGGGSSSSGGYDD